MVALSSPRHAPRAMFASLALTLVFIAGVAMSAAASSGGRPGAPGLRADAVTCIVLLLVGVLGAVIVRYSRRYLHGDAGLPRYFRWLSLTVAAVQTLLLANNLLLIALAWTATSVALHQLLTYYPDRVAALVAAHKKFIVTRLADVFFALGLVLVYHNVGSLGLDQVAAWAHAHPALTPSMQLAAVFVVVAVGLRSAQLPFHGWLTQVMEAPTPVSALLHAGVINMGGLVMIRLAPWMEHAEPARLLLVMMGLVSAVMGSLVMTTRVSIKVALAWSTCAQMGFMLVECGLGLWSLALIHLVAHSLYKAHAFLRAGSAVVDWQVRASAKPASVPSSKALGIVMPLGIACAMGVGLLVVRRTALLSFDLSLPVLVALVGLAVVPLFVQRVDAGSSRLGSILRAAIVVVSYFALHAAASEALPAHGGTSALGLALVSLGFLVLFALKTVLQMHPHGRMGQALHPWLFAGLYLDERFTRWTFRVWPPRLPRTLGSRARIYMHDTVGSRT